jgi:actin-related protein
MIAFFNVISFLTCTESAFVRTTTNVSDTFSCTLHVKLKKERKQIELSHELYQCAELFFSPTEVMQLSTSTADTGNGHQHAFPSLPQLILASLAACAIDDRRALLANICLSGSTTLLPHFAERLVAELKSELASQPSTRDAVRVRADPKRDHATWIGGNILSKQDQFRDKHWNLEGDTSPETDDFTMIMT